MTRWVCQNYRLGVLLIGGVMLVNALFFLQPRGVPLFTILYLTLFAMAPWFFLYQICLRRRSREALAALNEDCDPELLLEVSDDVLEQFDKKGKKRTPTILSWRLNKTAALISLGRYQEALELMEQVGERLPKKPDPNWAIYHCDRAAAYFGLKRAGEMARELDAAEAVMAERPAPEMIQRANRMGVETNRCGLFLLQGEIDRAEQGYQALLAGPVTTRLQVSAHLGLAKCALAREDRERAKSHLRYVLDHGNKLAARKTAQELWESL